MLDDILQTEGLKRGGSQVDCGLLDLGCHCKEGIRCL